MTKILALVSFILSLCFYAWNVKQGVLSWEFFMLLGFVLNCAADDGRVP